MTGFAGQYYISSIAICLTTLYVYLRRNKEFRLQGIIFILIALTELVAAIGGLFCEVFVLPGVSNLLLAKTGTYLYMTFHTVTSPIFCFYTMIIAGVNKKHTERFFLIFFAPATLNLLLIFQNIFTHNIFYFIEFTYRRSYLMSVLYVISAVYLVAAIYYLVRYHSVIANSTVIVLSGFMLCVCVSVLIQMFFPRILIETFMQSIVVLFILMTIENSSGLYDETTNVYNRRSFLMENLRSLENKVSYKIILLKIMNTRYYTKTFGYRFTQEVMQDIALWLSSISNRNWIYDCQNGIFAIMLYGKNQNHAKEIVDKIYKEFSSDWIIRNISISFQVQVCLARVPHDINSVENLIYLLDLNESKTENRVSIIREEQLRFMQRRTAIENALQKALQTNSLKVYYQPIWDCKADKIHSAEALVRLIDDDLGFIPPDEFIPVAEMNGTIAAIGQFVFEDACNLFATKKLKDIGIQFMEVNLSGVQFMHRSLPGIFASTLEHYKLSAQDVNLEISESAAVNKQETFQQTMKNLRNMKFKFSLDDYGTGYSNASYIFNMDFDIIKIDKTFLWEAEKKESAKIILRNTIRMIKEMGIKVIAEGVETKEQRDFIAGLGCDYCQGYFFCKPVPQEQFIEYVKKYNGIES